MSVIPSQNAHRDYAAKLKNWSKITPKDLDPVFFAEVMVEVHKLMGLSGTGSVFGPAFSEDVLRLEICGPKQDHFSIVDIPGLFRNPEPGITTEADMEMVSSMVHNYMENPRSVMLCVVGANTDVGTQEIVRLAKKLDPEGSRTLGVLTKPDLIDPTGEGPIIDILMNKKQSLKLGWHVLRNTGHAGLQDAKWDRDTEEEKFFATYHPWPTVSKDKVGVKTLRSRLQEVLGVLIRREFPKVKAEILKKLREAEKDRKNLGAKRDTSREQRQYLFEIANQFQRITTDALSAKYESNDCFDSISNLRLPTAVVDRNELFSSNLWKFGHSYDFKVRDEARDSPLTPKLPFPIAEANGDDGDSEMKDSKLHEVMRVRTTGDHSGLEEVMYWADVPRAIGLDTIDWLTEAYKTRRGFELGSFDPSVLAMTMKRQSEKWEQWALGYISDIISMVHKFILELLILVCPDENVRISLQSTLMEHLVGQYKSAYSLTETLLRVERTGTPMTLNHYFNDNLQKSRAERLRKTLQESAGICENHPSAIKMDDILATQDMSNQRNLVWDIHDILKSYYKVARKRFVDNVCMQAADDLLVTGPKTPLKLFSPEFVGRLTDSELEEIAGENAALKRERARLNKEIQNLDAGRKILV
ncbi:hypothetical protein MMC30_000175 [Trapelia coarctata]|nr:hypothetical protein [Trapelia coarctata]